MTTPVQTQTEVHGMTSLEAADRCDRCQAQAFVRVAVAGGQLLFCAHHYREVEASLAAAGATVLEDRRAALAGPS